MSMGVVCSRPRARQKGSAEGSAEGLQRGKEADLGRGALAELDLVLEAIV
jgi:hypothetical protein